MLGAGALNVLGAGPLGAPPIVVLTFAALALLALWTQEREDGTGLNPTAVIIAPSMFAVVVGAAGALILALSAFMPWTEDHGLTRIEGNTLLQSGFGFEFVVIGVLAAVAIGSLLRSDKRYWGTLLVPLAFLGGIYLLGGLSAESLALDAAPAGAALGAFDRAEPGIGHHVAAVGHALLFVSGLSFALARGVPARTRLARRCAG